MSVSVDSNLRFTCLEDLEKSAALSALAVKRFESEINNGVVLFRRILRVYEAGMEEEDLETCFILFSRVISLARIWEKRGFRYKSPRIFLLLKFMMKDSVLIKSSLKSLLSNLYSPSFLVWSSELKVLDWTEAKESIKDSRTLILDIRDNKTNTYFLEKHKVVSINTDIITDSTFFDVLFMSLSFDDRQKMKSLIDHSIFILVDIFDKKITSDLIRILSSGDNKLRPINVPSVILFDNTEEKKTFKMKFGVLTISDSCSQNTSNDKSGPGIVDYLKAQEKFKDSQFKTNIVPDESEKIKETLRTWSKEVEVILTTGGTGFGPRDVTPEATKEVIDRSCPGIVVAILQQGLKYTPMAALSRLESGICGNCLIVNLPGSPKACLESLPVLVPLLHHAVALLQSSPSASRHEPSK